MATRLKTLILLLFNCLVLVLGDADPAFLIHLYDNYIEINIKTKQHEIVSVYSAIITEHDCLYKYKFNSLESLLNIMRDAIDDDDENESTASHQLKSKGKNKLELIVLYDSALGEKQMKFILTRLKKESVSQETKILNHMQSQIYDLKGKNKLLKSMIVPRNGIILYSDCDQIPIGFSLCDGTKNTPDLRQQFVIKQESECIESKGETCKANTVNYDICYIMKN